jgi:hypothetical protein
MMSPGLAVEAWISHFGAQLPTQIKKIALEMQLLPN